MVMVGGGTRFKEPSYTKRHCLPMRHREPFQYFVHLQLLGAIQAPPFSHFPIQIAERREKLFYLLLFFKVFVWTKLHDKCYAHFTYLINLIIKISHHASILLYNWCMSMVFLLIILLCQFKSK